MPWTSLRVPASSANLGPGFDVHAISLQKPTIEVTLSRAKSGRPIVRVTGRYAKFVTTDPELHSGAKALKNLNQQFGIPSAWVLEVNVEIPPRKGLGLSGAEAVGAVMSANRLFNIGLDIHSVARIAAAAEPSHHLDNAAASALGGFNIISQHPTTGEPQIMTLRPPPDLGVVVIVPDIEKASTEVTRHVLPETVSRDQYVRSMGYVARISAAFAESDTRTIIQTIPGESVAETARADAGFYGNGVDSKFLREEKRLLLKEFHIAETIGGAGPSRALWYSISENRKSLKKRKSSFIQEAIEHVCTRLESLGHNVEEIFVTKPSVKGAVLKSTARARI
jgi:homoserine kinase